MSFTTVKLDETITPDTTVETINNPQKEEEKAVLTEYKSDTFLSDEVENSSSDSQNTWAINSDIVEWEIISLDQIDISDFNKVKDEILSLIKNPNPLVLYFKSEEIKEKFSNFINTISTKIVQAFESTWDNQQMLVSIYADSNYQLAWINNFSDFLQDTRFFDYRLYFKTSTLVNKKNQTLAKAFIKFYKKEADADIKKFLTQYRMWVQIEKIRKMYKLTWAEELAWKIGDKYLVENNPWLFLEQIAVLNPAKKDLLFELFSFDLRPNKDSKKIFSEIYKIFTDIAKNYIRDLSQIETYLYTEKNIAIKTQIDELTLNLFQNRINFYDKIHNLLDWLNHTDASFFWDYTRTKVINSNYKQVTRLFYWNKEVCKNRKEWMALKWDFKMWANNRFKKDIAEILSFKKFIIEINSHIAWPFLKPIIYSKVADQIKISEKDLLKGRYLMTLVLSDNYEEYKQLFTFFEELRIFLNFEDEKFNFNKIKIFAADLFITFAFTAFLYLYSPMWVFVSFSILAFLYYWPKIATYKPGLKWNFGIKTFATLFLIFSSFFWLLNLEQTKKDVWVVMNKMEKIWTYRTDKWVDYLSKKLEQINSSEMMTSIRDWVFWKK